MKMLKRILPILILLSGSLAHAQTRLDDIRLNLPQEYDWTKQIDTFKNDSTKRVQGWFVKNEQGQKMQAAIILSMDRAAISASFQNFIEQILGTDNKSQDITLLEEGKTVEGYPYALFKALVTKDDENDPGSFIAIFIKTETSIHALSFRYKKTKLSDKLVEYWSAILKNPVIVPGSAADSSKGEQSNNRINASKPNITYYWEGLMTRSKGEKMPVSLHYHKYDSLSGRYHKQLIVGSIVYPTIPKPHKIIGYIQNQRDASLHLYEFTTSGEVIQKLMTGTNGQKMEGYLIQPAEDGMSGIVKLDRKDTSTVATEVHVKNDSIFGKYVYSFDQGKITGRMTVQRNADGTVRLKISTIGKVSYHSYFIREESLTLNNQKLSFKAKLMGTSTVLSMQIQFFKGFARVIFTELAPRYDHRYGTQASLAGFYYKIK